jgi:hypothetical protein
MLRALRDGFLAVGRNWGLVLLLWAVNAGLAALLAVPLHALLGEALKEREAATAMRDGFDFPWWEAWHDQQKGWTKTVTPEISGIGFAYRNLDLLLRGQLPARVFDHGEAGAAKPLDPLIGGLGLLYLLVQAFLGGGLLSVLRRPAGGWKLRGLLHASGFYFGRLFRLALLTLLLLGVVFALNAPFARWADYQARDAVSESTALAWALGRRALLLLALAAVFVLSSYAKAIVVLEERASALLALVSAAGFCLRRAGAVIGHALALLIAAVLLLRVYAACDAAWLTTGYKTQLVSFALMQLFVCGRIALRLSFLGGALALLRADEGTATG